MNPKPSVKDRMAEKELWVTSLLEVRRVVLSWSGLA